MKLFEIQSSKSFSALLEKHFELFRESIKTELENIKGIADVVIDSKRDKLGSYTFEYHGIKGEASFDDEVASQLKIYLIDGKHREKLNPLSDISKLETLLKAGINDMSESGGGDNEFYGAVAEAANKIIARNSFERENGEYGDVDTIEEIKNLVDNDEKYLLLFVGHGEGSGHGEQVGMLSVRGKQIIFLNYADDDGRQVFNVSDPVKVLHKALKVDLDISNVMLPTSGGYGHNDDDNENGRAANEGDLFLAYFAEDATETYKKRMDGEE